MPTLLATTAHQSTTPEALGAIRDPDCNLAIWQRALPADFAPLLAGTPSDLRFTCAPDDLPALLAEALVEGGFGSDAALQKALIEDAAALAMHYCAVMGLARLELRLEVVSTDSCRKFHADYVTARLITTYVGQGTDWLDEADAARVAAGGEPQRINRLSTGDVGLFKGKLATAYPAIHRSPPIAGTGAVRLLLVLNPASKPFTEHSDSPLSPGGQVA
jgi:hypothetical protein